MKATVEKEQQRISAFLDACTKTVNEYLPFKYSLEDSHFQNTKSITFILENYKRLNQHQEDLLYSSHFSVPQITL
jgi:predicted metal-dependent HD superfamily phosphohydrolase